MGDEGGCSGQGEKREKGLARRDSVLEILRAFESLRCHAGSGWSFKDELGMRAALPWLGCYLAPGKIKHLERGSPSRPMHRGMLASCGFDR